MPSSSGSGDCIDTADSYGPEVSERLGPEGAVHPYPAGLVIGTKGGYVRGPHGGWIPDGRPEHLRAALEGSLERLKLERIDLYQLHTPESRVPFEESVGALAELQAGPARIRHIGLSNVSVKQLRAARKIVPIVSVQNQYSHGERGSGEVLTACELLDTAFIPWYPLGAGSEARAAKLKRIGAHHGATPAQVALAWLLARSNVMLPIPGTSSLAHLQENVAAGISAAFRRGPRRPELSLHVIRQTHAGRLFRPRQPDERARAQPLHRGMERDGANHAGYPRPSSRCRRTGIRGVPR